MFKMAKKDIPNMLTLLGESMDVYAPVKKGKLTNFEDFTEGAELDIDTLKTVKSPKDFFLPQVENLFSATSQGKEINIEAKALRDKPFVIFGVRSCDVRAMEILDSVYLSEPVDKFYEARRENGIILSLACNEPGQTCFCTTFNIDPAHPNADGAMWVINDNIYIEARTEKGENLVKLISKFLQEGSKNEIVQSQTAIREKLNKLPYSDLSLDGLEGNQLLDLFDTPQWEELHKTCLACGICTFICPTCQCYDIKDYDTGGEVVRYRCWDSCMYSDFTLMAHGNIRNSQKERFRQRFMHKLVYHPDNNKGEISCVGCGRCVNKCPSSLNIVKVIKSLAVKCNV
ncbi:MAG: 4Fe-4S dicluster domain-containing protein [Defluviitaleaceae bacterium]|nr:4Fe-4S dicluster domain-containing protein [Defluviitaleaceae bacterium]